MNILLATHNYYPYKWGGTEVYVASLAQYLTRQDHAVTIVAAVDDEAFETNTILFDDANLRICSYQYNSILVYGVQYKNITTLQIYSRKSNHHQNSWNAFIDSNEVLKKIDILHLNGFTPTIGLDLILSLKSALQDLKIVTSYHTAISCAKESLLFANTLKEQHHGVDDVADMFSYRLNLPYPLAKVISWLYPSYYLPFIPAIFNLKSLTMKIVESFDQLKNLTDEWWVYSEGIKTYLIQKGIAMDKLIFERHGIADFFINKERNETAPYKFLYSGRMIKIKGFHTLLKAWLKVKETPSRELWITGYPMSEDKKTLDLIKQISNRKDIIWLGHLDQQAIAKVYLTVNTVIIPSEVYEIGPLVFHEAIASGCRIISSNIGGCKELANYYSEQTITFCVGNADDLASKILNNKKTDPKKTDQTILSFNEHFKRILSKSHFYH